jgi:spectinomycin phosphotransferase
MPEKQALSNERIISCLMADYSIKVARLIHLPWGADTNAAIYKAESTDAKSYFVKLKYIYHPVSTLLIEFLHNAGIEQIIPPIKTTQGQLAQRIEDFTLIVYPFIEGQDGFSRPLTDEQWLRLGTTLKQIHETKVPSSLQAQIRRENYSPKWREAVRSLCPRMETESGGSEINMFMKKNVPLIRRLVDRAEDLGQKLRCQSFEFVLCHSDIHGGNVLIDKKGTIYIVDWDDPIMAPKERDLMFIGGGVGTIWNKPHEEKLFYKGYGKTEINPAILAYYRCERIVEDIAIYGQELLLAQSPGANKQEIYKQFVRMFEPQGVIEIALKTKTS